MHYVISPKTNQQGVVLLEALIAILIFSFGILGIVGLQATMIKGTSDARYRTQASLAIQNRLNAIWIDQGNLGDYAETDKDISDEAGLPGGRRTTVRGDASCGGDLSCFIVTVTWQQPGESQHSLAAVARVTGG